jgi:hypothetical protein
MRCLPLLVATGMSTGFAACGGSSTAPVASAELFVVNGARHPAVFAMDTLTWAGFGFGTERGEGNVYVTAAGAPTVVEILFWTDGQIQGVLPADVESGPTYVLLPTDSLGPLDLFVVPRTHYDPASHAWTSDASLPVALTGAAAGGMRFPSGGTVTGRVVLTGGRRTDGTLNRSTYLGLLAEDGRITQWQEAPDSLVPAGRYLHAMVGADRTTTALQGSESVAYMFGGVDSAGRVLSDALGIGLSVDGAYSLWTPMAPLPDRRGGLATTAAFGKIYAIGGFGADSLAARDVFYTTVLPSGTLNGWLIGPPLPEGLAFATAAVAGSMLFVLGGETGAIFPDSVADSTRLTATVYSIPISPLSGAFRDSVWTQLPISLLHARSRFSAAVVDDALVVTGGVYAGMPSAGETEFATITDGQLGTFQDFPGGTLAALAGGAVLGAATPLAWTAQGTVRITLVGGAVGATPAPHVWSK